MEDRHLGFLKGHHDERRPRRRTGSPGRLNPLIALLFVALWAGMVYGGYYYAKQYFDQSIQNVQQTNAVNVQMLEARLDTLSADLKEIENALRSAGLTLSNSDTTQKELNKKIEKLDKQLQELERSLKILKEAPNAAR